MTVGRTTDRRTDEATGIGAIFGTVPEAWEPCSLAQVARRIAARPELWGPHVRDDRTARSYVRVHARDDVEAWVLTWPQGTSTSLHDHGGSRGAFQVVVGTLVEDLPGEGTLRRHGLPAGSGLHFDAQHVHDVGNPYPGTAVSVHVYSPPLRTQTYYAFTGGRLETVAEVPADDRLSAEPDRAWDAA